MRPLRKTGAGRRRVGFTLIELLVVLAIIGTLAALSAPAFKGFGQSNAFSAGQRQLLDDLKFARQQAMKNRATVFFVFAPTNAFLQEPVLANLNVGQFGSWKSEALASLTNILMTPYASYAIYTQRRLGEQPGVDRPRYLTPWRALPDGVVFPGEIFGLGAGAAGPDPDLRPHQLSQRRFPFPQVLPGNTVEQHYAGPFRVWNDVAQMPALPFIAFDPSGRIADITYAGLQDALGRPVPVGADVMLGVGPGSALVGRQPDGQLLLGAVDLVETPRFGYTNGLIRISYLTGRATALKNSPR